MAEYKLSYTAQEIDEKLGKIDELVAVDNEIAAQINEVKNNGGIGWIETEIIEVFPEAILYSKDDIDPELVTLNDFVLEAGKTYEVVVNGVSTQHTAVETEGTVVLGYAVEGQGDYSIAYMPEFFGEGSSVLVWQNEENIPASTTISIKCKTEIIHSIDPKYLPEGGFGYVTGGTKILFDQIITTVDSGFEEEGTIGLVEGEEYVISINGTEYECVGKSLADETEGLTINYIGNSAMFGLEDTGEPFIVADAEGFVVFASDVNTMPDGEYHIVIRTNSKIIHKIDEKFLPEITWDFIGLGKEEIFNETLSGFSTNGIIKLNPSLLLVDGQEYEIIWDGVSYFDVCKYEEFKNDEVHDTISEYYLGNALSDRSGNECKYPFYIASSFDTGILLTFVLSVTASDNGNITYDKTTDTHTVVINKIVRKTTIPTKFIPNTIPNIQTAEVGQAIVVKTVDENGKPTEWEAINIPTDEHINELIAAYLANAAAE